MIDVWITNYSTCKIRTNRILRVAVEKRTMSSGAFYKCSNGTKTTSTNTTGLSYHWYPASRVQLVNKPMFRVINITRLRTREWKKHPALVKQVCRSRKAA